MNPLTSELAQAHICELRRDARRGRRSAADRPSRRDRRAARAAHGHTFTDHFVPISVGLFRHI